MLLGFVAFLFSSWACNDPYWNNKSPTELAPQDISNMDLSYAPLAGFDFSQKIMWGVNLSNADVSRANFTNADLRRVNLSDARAYSTIFDGADLRGAILDRLCFRGSSWQNAKLDPRWFEVVTVLDEKLKPNQDLRELDLSAICMFSYDLQNANLAKVNLSETNLAWANLEGASLQGANLTDANLYASIFLNADLKGATVDKDELAFAILCKTIMPDGQLSNAGCDRLQASPSP